ncbi:unnamed protein product, partial [Rotaria sp. Silwood2]
MNHKFQRKINNNNQNLSNSSRTTTDSFQYSSIVERTQSCPNFHSSELTASNEKCEITHRSEVVFLRTSNKVIAPFTLFTIPLTDNISVLILVE